MVRCLLMAACLIVSGCWSSTQSAIQQAARRKRTPDPETPAATNAGKAKAGGENALPAPPQAAASEPGSATANVEVAALPNGSEPAKTNERPAKPLTEMERRARSIANLEKVGQALVAYEKKHGRFPPVARDIDGDLLISWRVLILPELGYPELAARFRYDEAWDGKTNKLLLDYIPPEYQSPERFDNKTNYLGITGRNAVFGLGSARRTSQLKDGADNTLAIVEVDDKYAQEWTKPSDHVPSLDLPLDRLGGLRGEGAFGVLAGGRAVLLPKELPPSRWAALFTVAGGEPIGAVATFLKPPTAEPPPPALATIADDPDAANKAVIAGDTSTNSADDVPTAKASLPGSVAYVPDATKEEIPTEDELASARELLKDLYGKEYAKANTVEKRQEFVKKLLAEAPNVDQSPADFHEILRIVRDLATGIADTKSALAASDMLEQRFQIDPLPSRLKVLEELNKYAKSLNPVDPALKEAKRLAREAEDSDRYDVAIPARELVLKFSRLQSTLTRRETSRLEQEIESIKTARNMLAAAQRALQAIEEGANDPANEESVGRYLCFVKNRWEAGLPYLAKAADIRLRGVASLEMASDRSQEETLTLADQMWDLALMYKQPQRRGLQLRAVYWYQVIAPRLSGSLVKLRMDRRLEEVLSQYGQEDVDRVLAPLRPKDGAKVRK